MTEESQVKLIIEILAVITLLINTWRTELANRHAKAAKNASEKTVVSTEACDVLVQKEKQKSYELGLKAGESAAHTGMHQVTDTEFFRKSIRDQVEGSIAEIFKDLRSKSKSGKEESG
jgi:DnaJ-class molecular chaperone